MNDDIEVPELRRKLTFGEWRGQEVDWAFLMKALPYGTLAYGIDQAGKRSHAANRARLKRGCKPGVPDTYILWNGVTLWLERKDRSGLSEAQKVFRDQCLKNRGNWAMVETTEDVELACRDAGIPLRATLGDIRTRIAEQNERLPAKKKQAAPRKAPPRFTASERMARKMNERRMG